MSERFLQAFNQEFVDLLARHNGGMSGGLRRLVSRLVTASQMQHSCIELQPEAVELLQDQPVVGGPGEHKPLIFLDNRLYLQRYFHYEQQVAAMVAMRNRPVDTIVPASLAEDLGQAFGEAPGNRQKLAAMLAMTRQFLIITGGPGTGKTSTVRKVLTLLRKDSPDLEIRLAAPTGKAAMRLEESIGEDHPDLTVQTLHRLLGIRRDGRSWRHGPSNPIQADLLIIDEASMIDLPMMHRLLSAIREDTRLILLGDPNQLPSVDTGNVLADLCQEYPGYSEATSSMAATIIGEPLPIASRQQDPGLQHGLTDALCELDHSYRFDANSDIGRLAQGIKSGADAFPVTADGSVEVLDTGETDVTGLIQSFWSDYFALLGTQPDAASSLATFDKFRILCSRRGGPLGVSDVNSLIESHLEERGLKQTGQAFYPGRPVLVTRNDYNLGLFNGDIGITAALTETTDDDRQYLVVFPGNSEDRVFLASRLPEHQTCFAMTVHKAQGSEFDHVLLLLSEESSDEAISLLTRELLYTAVTRARHHLTVCTPMSRWRDAIAKRAARTSGMSAFLESIDS